MGLDVQLWKYSVSPEQLASLRERLSDGRRIRRAMCHDRPAYQASEDEEEHYMDALEASGLYDFLAALGEPEKVNHPSDKNPYRTVGYWRVGYGKETSDPARNYRLATLYEAFPEVGARYMQRTGADWDYARQVVERRLEECRSRGDQEMVAAHEVFLETVDFVLAQPDPETYFLSWFG